ncbi:MAG: precorrin-6y C5,15-methyltransferase (decarboxylating) subunit CbiE [Synechococcaceae cyanobacterium]|nr:precorrin-6y C5,15-methyltransferase (decarboxylating) subunit CbiE [Synechococcaceae cyanobacterium]
MDALAAIGHRHRLFSCSDCGAARAAGRDHGEAIRTPLDQRTPPTRSAAAGRLVVIGCDAGGLACLAPACLEQLRDAALIAAPSRLLDDLRGWLALQPAAETAAAALPELLASDRLAKLLAPLQQALAEQRRVVVLASGDPLWFGIGRWLLQHFPPEQLQFHPAPTALQLAFARLARPWQDASWISLHGRDPEPLASRLQQRPPALAVLTDPGRGGAAAVRELLRASGLEASYQLWLAERLGHPRERLLRLLPADPLPADLDPLHLVLLIAEPPASPDPATLPLFGLDDGLWLQHPDHPGLMTKREVRIQLLADLDLPGQGVLWDLGAGVGSVGLEALRLRPALELWAVERRLGAAALIAANAERLGVRPAAILEAEASDALASLPDPDRVLLGGGGPQRGALLATLLPRLRPHGLVLIPLASLEPLAALRQQLLASGLSVRISQLQAWRGAALAEGTRLAPLNPVLVISGRRR